jgi:hypothetical protein
MAKYHIDVNGAPAACTATTRACPRGGEEEHGATPQEVLEKYEAKQAANTMPKAVKKPSKANKTRKVLSKIAIEDAKLQKVAVERAKVMASIQTELDELKARASAHSEARKAAMAEVFDAADIEDFANKETAATLYKFGYDNGSGHNGFRDLERRVLAKSRISMGLWHLERGSDSIVASLAVNVDEDMTEEEITRAAELIEKIYPTQQEIQPSIKIDVYSRQEDVSFSRDLETKEWVVRTGSSSSNDFASSNARDAIEYLKKEYIAFGDPDDWSRGW